MHGDALIVAGTATLTVDAPGQLGSLVLTAAPNAPPDTLPNASTAFAATFDMLIGGSCGAEGVLPAAGCGAAGLSFSFGDGLEAVAPFGEEGAGSGLRLQILTGDGSRRLVVIYGGQVLASVGLNETIRSHAIPVQLAVQYAADGLWVRLDTTQLVAGLGIPGWSPRRTWRFGFGARTGSAWGAHDSHAVDNVEIRLGRLGAASGAVPVEVSLNGAQFSHGGLMYTYLPAVRALSILPTSGPQLGQTNVTIVGAGLIGGRDFRCSFDAEAASRLPSRCARTVSSFSCRSATFCCSAAVAARRRSR